MVKGSRRIKVQWLLYNLSTGSAPIVTFLFWTIAYDGTQIIFIYILKMIFMHVNSALSYVLLDFCSMILGGGFTVL